MATVEDSFLDEFLTDSRGGDRPTWERDHNKKQCPDCGGIHELDAVECTVCGWSP